MKFYWKLGFQCRRKNPLKLNEEENPASPRLKDWLGSFEYLCCGCTHHLLILVEEFRHSSIARAHRVEILIFCIEYELLLGATAEICA